MNKTTTRLATTTAVLLMSAFAIILAQHDARKTAQEHDHDIQLQTDHAEPPTPLSVDDWPSSSALVRGNNNDPADPFNAPAIETLENPLRNLSSEIVAVNELPPSAAELFAVDVVTASGETPARPASLPDLPNSPTSPVLQPLPNSLPAGFPNLNSLPGSSLPLPGTSPSNADAAPTQSTGKEISPGRASSSSEPAFPISQPMAQPVNRVSAALPGQGAQASQVGQSNPLVQPTTVSPPAQASLPSTGIPQNLTGTTNRSDSSSGTPQFPVPGIGPKPSNLDYPGRTSGGTNASSPSQSNASSFGQSPASSAGSYANGASANTSETTASSGRSALNAGGNSQFAADSGNFYGPRATLASNQPGSRFLDGSQNPIMQIHKRAPEEITVGKKATFVITVRNAGNATAHDVTVVDRIPRGARFSDASPSTSPAADGLLTWKLGEMNAGDEKTINLQIIPEAEGEVGSVASVHFAAQASVRTIATAPQLEVVADSTGPVIIGQSQQVAVTIRNTGSGISRGVRLEADIPSQLKHESGEAQLEAFIGDLRPNESKRLVLNVAAVQPGQATCPLRAVNEDGIQAQTQFAVDVRAPQLAATIAGPARRYLERQATYQIVVTNSGTAVARNLYFDVHLPVGLKFISADIAQATYHPESHSITLGLAELNPGASGTFTVTVLPVELGPQNIRFNATGDLGVTAEAKGQMVVEGLSELTFAISQDNGTVEVGATTTYSVQISNVGNQSDKSVQLLVQIPEGAKLLKVDAPVDFREEPGRLVFAPLSEMRSRDMKTIRFQVQHNRAGNQVIRAQLTSANWPVPVLKEEGTLVYNDQ